MRRLLTTMVMAVTLLAGGCGSDEPPVNLAGKTNEHGTKTAGDDLAVEADDFYFGPTYIKADAGQQFSVEIHNEGGARHTFTSPALGVDLELEPGARRTLTLKAPASGTAEFHCRFHEIEGMQGAIYVG